MSTMKITIEMENAAFHPDPLYEAVRILRKLADSLEQGHGINGTALMDINGNKVGHCQITG